MTSVTIARTYQRFFYTHPNRTLALTGGVLNAVGDIVAQISQNVVRGNIRNSILLAHYRSYLRTTNADWVGTSEELYDFFVSDSA